MSSCAPGHRPRRRFRVGADSRCVWHAAFSRQLLGTSIPTCAVVGTILTAINQGTVLVDGRFPSELWWKIPMTYSVPFLVATWGQLRALALPSTEDERSAVVS